MIFLLQQLVFLSKKVNYNNLFDKCNVLLFVSIEFYFTYCKKKNWYCIFFLNMVTVTSFVLRPDVSSFSFVQLILSGIT